jgi:hypothetical protein
MPVFLKVKKAIKLSSYNTIIFMKEFFQRVCTIENGKKGQKKLQTIKIWRRKIRL